MKQKIYLDLTYTDYKELCNDSLNFLSQIVGQPVVKENTLYEYETEDGMEVGIEYNALPHLTVGAVYGRHEMPCNKFLFMGEVNPLNLEGIYDTVSKKLDGFESVTLYVTGLTVVTTTVMKYCFKHNISLTLMHYDRENDSYYPQEIL